MTAKESIRCDFWPGNYTVIRQITEQQALKKSSLDNFVLTERAFLLLIRCDTLQRKSDLCIPRKRIARPQSHFNIHVHVSDLYIPRIGLHMNVKIETVAAQFLFWE